MTDAEMMRFIREEIKKQLNVILSGKAGTNTIQTEDIEEMFPGMPTIPGRPIMHPFGISSRAPRGTIQVTARAGEHTGNRMVLGHRDKSRPACQAGELVLYNAHGQQIRLENGEIKIGSASSSEPFVLGLVFQKFAQDLLTMFKDHKHMVTAPGAFTAALDPATIQKEIELKASPIDDKAILSDLIMGEK